MLLMTSFGDDDDDDEDEDEDAEYQYEYEFRLLMMTNNSPFLVRGGIAYTWMW